MNPQNRMAVVICSVGRPACLAETAPFLARQGRRPDRLLYVVTDPRDVPADLGALFPAGPAPEVLIAPKGLPRQRNVGLAAVEGDCGLVVFFDDDFLPCSDALAGVERGFALWPQVNGMTGRLIADGINSAGITHAQAAALIEADETARSAAAGAPAPQILRRGLAGLYGCNMAYRLAALQGARFDERLPLYGWQEDIDFAARIAGEKIKTDAFSGVHLGIKSGRETAGVKLGYSQMVNPWYLVRKGSMRPRFALKLALRNLAANHLRARRPEPWIDRAARARGNRLGLFDILRGRADPERILTL